MPPTVIARIFSCPTTAAATQQNSATHSGSAVLHPGTYPESTASLKSLSTASSSSALRRDSDVDARSDKEGEEEADADEDDEMEEDEEDEDDDDVVDDVAELEARPGGLCEEVVTVEKSCATLGSSTAARIAVPHRYPRRVYAWRASRAKPTQGTEGERGRRRVVSHVAYEICVTHAGQRRKKKEM